MTPAFATFISIAALGLSALAWTVASFVAPVITRSYFDAVPPELSRRMAISSWANKLGAILAAIGVAAQAYATAMA